MIEPRQYLSKKIFKKIQQAHNGLVGHSGVQKTIERLQKLNTTWSGMRNDDSTYQQYSIQQPRQRSTIYAYWLFVYYILLV